MSCSRKNILLSYPASIGVSLAGAVLLHATLVHAQQVTELPEIVIESSQLGGVEAKAEASGAAYSVITSQQIKDRQYRHAADALRAIPGLHLDSSGSSGSVTALRIRGAESNHTKVLIDGVTVNSVSDGGFDFSTLLATDIERIEVLRGPQSGIYGGNALSGVVNIITRKGGGAPSVSATFEGGSRGTYQASGNLSTGGDNGYVSLSGALRETEGFNIASVGNEKDGSRQATFFARGGYEFSPVFRVDGMLRHQQNKTDIDEDNNYDNLLEDVSGANNERQQNLGHLTGTLKLFDGAWLQKFHGEFLDDDFDSLTSASVAGFNYSNRSKFSYLSQFNFGSNGINHTLSGLIDHTNERLTSSNIAGERKRQQTGYVAEYRLDIMEQFYLSGNVRYDDNDSFENETTYKIGASYRQREFDTRFHVSYGRGIQDPTLIELYGYFGNFNANPNLVPEESIGWDVGIEKGFFDHRFVVDVTYFQADLTNEISADYSVFPNTPINLDGESERKGVEVSLTARPTDNLTLTGSYTYTDARQPNDTLELRRPRHSASANITYLFLDGKARLNLEAIYRADVMDIGENYATTKGDDYTLVNLAASYQLSESMEVFARAENLFDEDYQEVRGFNTAPLSVYAGVRIKLSE